MFGYLSLLFTVSKRTLSLGKDDSVLTSSVDHPLPFSKIRSDRVHRQATVHENVCIYLFFFKFSRKILLNFKASTKTLYPWNSKSPG